MTKIINPFSAPHEHVYVIFLCIPGARHVHVYVTNAKINCQVLAKDLTTHLVWLGRERICLILLNILLCFCAVKKPLRPLFSKTFAQHKILLPNLVCQTSTKEFRDKLAKWSGDNSFRIILRHKPPWWNYFPLFRMMLEYVFFSIFFSTQLLHSQSNTQGRSNYFCYHIIAKGTGGKHTKFLFNKSKYERAMHNFVHVPKNVEIRSGSWEAQKCILLWHWRG